MGYPGMRINESDGHEKLGFPEFMSSPLFYLANPGDKLILCNKAYKFSVATYALDVDPKWLYTYGYAPDQSWTVYQHDLKDSNYSQKEYKFSKQVYFRLCLQKADGTAINNDEDINDIIIFSTQPTPPYKTKPWINDEAKIISDTVKNLRTKHDMVFALMTDTHYTVNGTWQDTIDSVKLLHKAIGFDGIIHLGDISDGMVTKEATQFYAKKILSDLKSCGVPLWLAVGNHDTNYFKNNPSRLSIEEQQELYFDGKELRHFVDLPRLRMIFLDSFDPNEKFRYGYSSDCIAWIKHSLDNLPRGNKAIIFSHLPPLTRLQFWAKAIRGNDEITEVLQQYKDKILAWINGHNHADFIDNKEGVPIISIANAKC